MSESDNNLNPHSVLVALMRSAKDEPLLIGRTHETIAADTLLAIGIDQEGRPVIRNAKGSEIDIPRWVDDRPEADQNHEPMNPEDKETC